MDIDGINKLAIKLRKRALEIAYKSGRNGSHLGGGLSTVEIFATLYGGILNVNASNSQMNNRDRLIVSKGHCVLSYYAVLEYFGFISKEEIESFETNGSLFHGHATRNLSKGIEFSGGSLSMGMSFAVGVAIATKKKGLNNRVYTIIGDGECDEGLIWEAAMSASNYRLDNFVMIIDANKLQYDGFTKDVMNHASLLEKFNSFGFYSVEVDGHNCEKLYEALQIRVSGMPLAIIANTIKGKGISFMENKKEWHHSIITQQQYEQALREVE